MRIILFVLIFLLTGIISTQAQITITKGKIFDATTKEPLSGVTISETGFINKTSSAENGLFIINTNTETPELLISFVGYDTRIIKVADEQPLSIALLQKTASLETVVITANREAGLRTEAPVAISKITSAPRTFTTGIQYNFTGKK